MAGFYGELRKGSKGRRRGTQLLLINLPVAAMTENLSSPGKLPLSIPYLHFSLIP
jgi:hypothetical protein